jgi:hypothetical protein
VEMVALPLASYNFVVMESFRGPNNAMIIIRYPMTVVHRRVLFNIAEMGLFNHHKNAMMETL